MPGRQARPFCLRRTSAWRAGHSESALQVRDSRSWTASVWPYPICTGYSRGRPAVIPEELPWIDVADRSYVAAEINAFLVAWLASLPCPVVNRPTPRSLCGPGWDRLHWKAAAARVGAPWYSPRDERTSEIDDHLVVVCGHACVGAHSRSERRFARALAEAAGVDLLGVRFVGGCVASASPMPDICDPAVQAAVLAHFDAQ